MESVSSRGHLAAVCAGNGELVTHDGLSRVAAMSQTCDAPPHLCRARGRDLCYNEGQTRA